MRCRSAILLVALFAFPAIADETPPDSLAAAFVAGFRGDSFAAIEPFMTSDATLDDAWRSMKEVIETYDCIDVTAYRVATTERDGELLVELEGHGVTTGAPRRPVVLPRLWHLQCVREGGQWKISSVATAEQLLADEIVAATANETRRRLVDEYRGSSRDALLREIMESVFRNFRRADDATLEFATSLVPESTDVRTAAFCRRMLATVNHLCSSEDRAFELAREALDLSEFSGCDDGVAEALFSIGITHWLRRQDRLTAISYLRQSGAMCDTLDDPRIALKSLYMASFLESSLGNYAEALLLGERNAALAKKYGWRQGEMDSCFTLATVHSELQNFEIAERWLDEASRIALELKSPKRACYALHSLGESAAERGDLDAAAGFLRRALALALADREVGILGMIRTSLGEVLVRQGRAAEAAEVMKQIEAELSSNADPAATYYAMTAIARFRLAESKPEDALQFSRRALAVGVDPGVLSAVPLDFHDAWTVEGMALRRLGRDDDAAAAFREAIDIIERRRGEMPSAETTASRFLEDKTTAYRELAELLVDRGQLREAVAMTDRMKARSLVDSLQRGHVDLSAGMTDEERSEEKRFNERIARLNVALSRTPDRDSRKDLVEELTRARLELEQFTSELYLRRPDLRLRRPEGLGPSLDELGAILPTRDDAILDYLIGDDRSTLFVIRRSKRDATEIRAFDLGISGAELTRRVKSLTKKVASRNLVYRHDAEELYRILVAPAEQSLTGVRQLCIVPDGALWGLPFQALGQPSGQPLLARYALYYAPSLETLRLSAGGANKARSQHSLLALGNPMTGSAEAVRLRAMTRDVPLGDLPEAEAEAREIAGMYDEELSLLLTRAEAREATFKERASKFDILHLAAHALVDDRRPMYSSIVLARAADESDDGLLEAREIADLDLNASLVVLSACSTARGAVFAGEGLIGLSRAFALAGCPRMIATQWELDSAAAYRMMVEFHRRLAASNDTPASALRFAQLSLMREPRYSHPYYWAPFMVLGLP